MNRFEIMSVIKKLSHSQGSYGRLYNDLLHMEKENPEAYETIMSDWEKMNFGNEVDFIMFLEG